MICWHFSPNNSKTNTQMSQKCEQFSYWPFCLRCFEILGPKWSPYVMRVSCKDVLPISVNVCKQNSTAQVTDLDLNACRSLGRQFRVQPCLRYVEHPSQKANRTNLRGRSTKILRKTPTQNVISKWPWGPSRKDVFFVSVMVWKQRSTAQLTGTFPRFSSWWTSISQAPVPCTTLLALRRGIK